MQRRDALRLVVLGLFAGAALPRALRAASSTARRVGLAPAHPAPREGITAAKVLADADVPMKYKDAYDAAREFPAILDGLYCHCDCAERDGLYSLLACYETRMPQSCGICSGEGRLAGRLARRGKSLDEIRAAIDKEYGEGHDGRRGKDSAH